MEKKKNQFEQGENYLSFNVPPQTPNSLELVSLPVQYKKSKLVILNRCFVILGKNL